MKLEPGTLLVSSVGLSDGFDRTVVLLLDADEHGSLGVVLNRLAPYDLAEALPGWDGLATFPAELFAGGPVSPIGAICLAAPTNVDEEPPGWRLVFDGIGLLHLDTPQEIVAGAYRDLRIFAGYAGWGPGQLDEELAQHVWFPTVARYSDVFDPQPDTLWHRCARRLGGQEAWLATWTPTPEFN